MFIRNQDRCHIERRREN
jgi:hypothetical protein